MRNPRCTCSPCTSNHFTRGNDDLHQLWSSDQCDNQILRRVRYGRWSNGRLRDNPACSLLTFVQLHKVRQEARIATGEEVMGVIANARKMKMFGASWDTYTIVITNRRMILAQMTQSLLNAAIMEAQAKAKAEGKGFFAIVKDQMAAQFRFALRYETMSPDQSLTETAGNFAIENTQITAISMKLNDSGEMEYSEFKIIIESSGGEIRISDW